MALKTKNEVVQEIAYELYGGMPSVDRAISDNFILRKLNNVLAEFAMKSAIQNERADEAICVDDIFYLTYSGLSLSADPVLGAKYVTLPAQPVGLPGKRNMIFSPPANRGGVRGDLFKPITRIEATLVRSLPGSKKVYHFTENGREYFIDEWGIMATYSSVNLSIVSSGANDLTAFLNMPDDMIAEAKQRCLAELRPMTTIRDDVPFEPKDEAQPR